MHAEAHLNLETTIEQLSRTALRAAGSSEGTSLGRSDAAKLQLRFRDTGTSRIGTQAPWSSAGRSATLSLEDIAASPCGARKRPIVANGQTCIFTPPRYRDSCADRNQRTKQRDQ
jgi:hypothetical protein